MFDWYAKRAKRKVARANRLEQQRMLINSIKLVPVVPPKRVKEDDKT